MKDTDFIGFSFNGVTSKSLGIYHVSDGSRYNENLIPNLQDKTANIEGGDGTLYWNSFYTNRPWTLQCAFDNVSELQLRRMRQVFSARQVGRLVFDEVPYKYYIAKVSATPQIRYICFNELNNPNDEEQGTHRVYKGDLTIQMMSYFPFAKDVAPFSDDYNEEVYKTKSQWLNGVDLLPNATHWFTGTALSYSYNTVQTHSEGSFKFIPVFNPGDEETDFFFYISLQNAATAGHIQLYKWSWHDYVVNGGVGLATLYLDAMPYNAQQDSGKWIRINTRARLIEGGTFENGVFVPSGILYNKYIISGDFFKIPVTQLGTNEKNLDTSTTKDGAHYGIYFDATYAGNSTNPIVEYNYLFY